MVTYRRTPTVLVLLAVAVALFAVASGMVIPTDSFQQVNESDSLSGMVTPTDSFQQVNESDSSELEWSLVTGVYTLFEYTLQLTAKQYISQEPPIVTTEERVAPILSTACGLLMQYELMNKVDSTGDLQVIMRQNLMDVCNWVRLSFIYIQ
jgi:hypothetical protein